LARAAVLANIAICFSVASARSAQPADYEKHVKPILAARCYRCHGPVKQESGLRLDTAALAVKGGDSGAAIVAGKSAESRLVAAIKGGGDIDRMPKDGRRQTAHRRRDRDHRNLGRSRRHRARGRKARRPARPLVVPRARPPGTADGEAIRLASQSR
jgi:hypothetical protein